MRGCAWALVLAGAVVLGWLATVPARAVDVSPLEKLVGRWVGEGRLGVRDNPTESVKCRVTYVHARAEDQLKQTIRCASGSGNVEVQSVVSHMEGTLTGTWKELTRDMSGDLAGTVTPRGFKVAVKGEALNANMDIVLVGAKQVIEIQFIHNSLMGLTLILDKG
jgi:hypothetical protein